MLTSTDPDSSDDDLTLKEITEMQIVARKKKKKKKKRPMEARDVPIASPPAARLKSEESPQGKDTLGLLDESEEAAANLSVEELVQSAINDWSLGVLDKSEEAAAKLSVHGLVQSAMNERSLGVLDASEEAAAKLSVEELVQSAINEWSLGFLDESEEAAAKLSDEELVQSAMNEWNMSRKAPINYLTETSSDDVHDPDSMGYLLHRESGAVRCSSVHPPNVLRSPRESR